MAGATVGGVTVANSGAMGDARPACGWPNLTEMARLALSHLDEICDPELGFVPYVGGCLGHRTPSFMHHRWDWIEVLPYAIIGRIVARRLTGCDDGNEIEVRQRRLLLSAFHNLDGFAYPHYAKGWSEDTGLCLWEQGRVMYALMAWFEESHDERLLAYVRGIVQALRGISSRCDGRLLVDAPWDSNGAFGRLSPMSMVEPLMKYYSVTGDSDALEFCEGQVRWLLDPATGFVDDRRRLGGFVRGCGSAIACTARYGAATGDEAALQTAEELLHSLVDLASAYGATPEGEPCCTNMEITTAALALMSRGRGDWWETIDRFFRNQTSECQFREWDEVAAGSVEGEPKPWDDTRDILRRSVGGFAWASARERIYWPGHLMVCCTGHAIWTLGKIVEHAVTLDGDDLTVNLRFNLDLPTASVTSAEPFEGRLTVTPRAGRRLLVRKPSYSAKFSASIDGRPIAFAEDGPFLVFEGVGRGETVTITHDMPERETEEVVCLPQGEGEFGSKSEPKVIHRVATRWRGNTVMGVDYERGEAERLPYEGASDPRHRMYARRSERLADGFGRETPVRFFIPDTKFVW